MTIRLFGALLCGAAFLVVVSSPDVSAQGGYNGGAGMRTGSGPGSSGSTRTTTVKSSKSNTSDRMGGGGGFHIGDNDSPRPQIERRIRAQQLGIQYSTDGAADSGGARRTNGSVGDPHETTGDGRRKSITSDRTKRRGGDGSVSRPIRSD